MSSHSIFFPGPDSILKSGLKFKFGSPEVPFQVPQGVWGSLSEKADSDTCEKSSFDDHDYKDDDDD